MKVVAKRILVLDEGVPGDQKGRREWRVHQHHPAAEWCGDLGIAQGDYVVLWRGVYEGTKYGSVVVIQKLNAGAAHRDGRQTQTQVKVGASG